MFKQTLFFLVVLCISITTFSQNHYTSTKYNYSSREYNNNSTYDLQSMFTIHEKDSCITVNIQNIKKIYCVVGKEIKYKENQIWYAVKYTDGSKYIMIFDLKNSLIKFTRQSGLYTSTLFYYIAECWTE
jgi:hypothetical protein